MYRLREELQAANGNTARTAHKFAYTLFKRNHNGMHEAARVAAELIWETNRAIIYANDLMVEHA